MRPILSAVIVCLAMLLGALPLAAQGQTAAVSVGAVADSGEDLNGDGLYDNLLVTVELNATQSASYYVVGSITDRVLVSEGASFKTYPAGKTTVELRFNGTELYRGMRDGPYRMVVQVISTEMTVLSQPYTTSPYTFTQFQHAQDAAGRIPVESRLRMEPADNSLLFETANLTTKIFINEPKISFFFRNGTEDQANFSIVMERVIGFADSDHDMVYTPGSDKTIMSGELAGATWEFIGVIGRSFDFAVEGTAAMKDASGNSYPVRFRLIFPSTGFISDRAYKFDYEMEFAQVLPGVTNIAVLHRVTDVAGGHSFRESPSGASGMLGVDFVRDDNGQVRGSYKWVDRADVEAQDGSSSSVRVFSSMQSSGSTLALYMSYEYTPTTLRIYHDPVLEINPLAFSFLHRAAEVFSHNPAFYAAAAGATALIVVGAMVVQHRRPRRQFP